MPPPIPSASTGLTITNPLVLYRALLATKHVDPDPAQHRLALHLQKLYNRLKDYSPQQEYAKQLKQISHTIGEAVNDEDPGNRLAVPGHPIRRNPLFAHLFTRKGNKDTLALTRVFTDHEAAMNVDSPQGLLLHGEVGTGKSMLLDLLADSLPTVKKRRWHFNTFMLETMAKLESLRKSRLLRGSAGVEHSLLWLAKDMVEKSPILFLDEFQLPDRAASKILSSLLTTFFQLGGVLVASSNRMPEELAKASGVEFAPPPRSGSVRRLLGLGTNPARGTALSDNGEFTNFLEVLKARCEVWEMEGAKDWRRRETELSRTEEETEKLREEVMETFSGLETLSPGNLGLGYEQSRHLVDDDKEVARSNLAHTPAPKNYLLSFTPNDEMWDTAIQTSLQPGTPRPVPWTSKNLSVYGRLVYIPRQFEGVALWTFDELCGGAFGPADYITMASNFHTVIIDQVPVLTMLMKNEARRLITLLDALYEARCKLVVRADAGPDDLFFPEIQAASSSPVSDETQDKNVGDQVYSEVFSEIYQDQTSPFRPNITAYKDQDVTKAGYDPDEDADFGPNPRNGIQVDFGVTSAFIGEDERFAYKRACSRLWEMCGTRWHARSGDDWWKPLSSEIRTWEKGKASLSRHPLTGEIVYGDVKMGEAVELDKPAGLQGKELEAEEAGLLRGKTKPTVAKEYPEPKMGWTPWGMVSWNRKDTP